MTPEKLTPLFELGYEVDTLTRKWHDDLYTVHVRSPHEILVIRVYERAGEVQTEIVRGPRNAPIRSVEDAHRAIVDHIAAVEHKVLATLADVPVPAHAAENA